MHDVVSIGLAAIAVHGAVGVLFAGAFHARGLVRMDPSARGAGVVFRLLVTPGVIALWPWLLARWWRVENAGGPFDPPQPESAPRRLRAVHAAAWEVLAVAGPTIVALALAGRPAAKRPSLAPASARAATLANPNR